MYERLLKCDTKILEYGMTNNALFADVGNLYYCVGKKFEGRKLDYKKYYEKAKEYGNIYRAFAYGAQLNDEATHFITCLRHFGYDPKYKKPKEEGKKTKIDWDVGISMDVVRLIDKLDVVILGSADPDLVSLVEWIKERGVKCIVLACGINKDLKEASDRWIEIEENLLEEIKKPTTTTTEEIVKNADAVTA